MPQVTQLNVAQLATLSSTFEVRNVFNGWLDNYDDEMDYFTFLDYMGRAVVTPTMEYTNITEDTVQASGLTVGTTVAGTGGANVTIVFDGTKAVPIKREIVMFKNGVTGLVWSVGVNGANWNVAIKPLGTGTNIPATGTGEVISIMSDGQEEGGIGVDTVRRPTNVKRSNFCQTINTTDRITDVAGSTEIQIQYNGRTYILNKLKAQQMLIHRMKCANAKLFGVKGLTTGPDGGQVWTTNGLRNEIIGGGGSAQSATANVFSFVDDMKTLALAFDAIRGTGEYMGLSGQTAHLAIDSSLGATSPFNGGGVTYGSFNGNKDIALAMGVRSLSFGGYTIHLSRFKTLEHKGLTGGVGYEAFKKEIYMIPNGKAKVKGGQMQDRVRTRYTSFDGTKDNRYVDFEGGIYSPNKVSANRVYEYQINSTEGAEFLGIEQFLKFNLQ